MRLFRLLVACFVIGTGPAFAQKLSVKNIEATIHQAVEKAYPACVRMWGIDTVSNQQMSAPFSGVVVTAQGHILTAAHTTEPGRTYKVMFANGKVAIGLALGKIEMADDRTVPDVAMMKIITPGTWPYAEMGYSAALQVNEPCISIAYPEGINQPQPVIRFGRITTIMNDRGFVQSTCIMEPGDSGGPLFDGMGRVIGLHSAINVPEDINFEIPVDHYRKYWTALQVAEKYNALPAIVDVVNTDPLAANIKSYKELENLRTSFAALETKLASNCLLIISKVKGNTQKIDGTLLSTGKGSFIVSKSSLVGESPVILIKGKQMTATVIARSRENDLVLLQTKETIKGGIAIKQVNTDTIAFKELGKFLVSPRADTASTISVLGSLQISVPKTLSMGFLGASVAFRKGPLQLNFVREGSPAANSDLQEGDEVISINNVIIDKPESYGPALQQYWPGDTITMSLKRAGSTYTKHIVLADRPIIVGTHPAEIFNGGKSLRRDGFQKVFMHDAVLTPSQCGGPLFDAEGHFQGINIARFSRVGTLALPAHIVFEFVNTAMKQ